MKDTGGSAFPVTKQNSEYGETLVYAETGMTLRDWFAGQALAGIARTGTYDGVMATQSYSVADAMIAERSK